MITELVKMRTRELELDIAGARRREKEAGVELERLKAAAARMLDTPAGPPLNGVDGMGPAGSTTFDFSSLMGNPTPAPDFMQSYQNFVPPSLNPLPPSTNPPPMLPTFNPQTNQTHFDVDSLLQESNLDGFLNWLPSLGGGGNQPSTMDPAQLDFPQPSFDSTAQEQDVSLGASPSTLPTPSAKRRASSPALEVKVEEGEAVASNKRSKKSSRRVVMEDTARCITCATSLARVILRTSSPEGSKTPHFALKCLNCKPNTSSASEEGAHHGGIVTLELRKRLRASMEAKDEGKWPDERRIFCDICQRPVASGQITNGQGRESLLSSVEIICSACDGKYQRWVGVPECTPCLRDYRCTDVCYSINLHHSSELIPVVRRWRRLPDRYRSMEDEAGLPAWPQNLQLVAYPVGQPTMVQSVLTPIVGSGIAPARSVCTSPRPTFRLRY